MANPDSEEMCMNLIPTKKRKVTNFAKCVICQVDSKETLRSGRETSIQKLVAALQLRMDDVYERLRPDLESLASTDVQWHSKCYERWTSKENLRYVQSRSVSSSPTPSTSSTDTNPTQPSRMSRSQSNPTDWAKCLFCKHLTHKKVSEMVRASTFTACNSIKEAATAKGDDDMLMIIAAVNNDLIAAEARYHRACYASYISKVNLKSTRFHEGEKETLYATAFRELVEEITQELNDGKAFEMSMLLSRYQALLQATGVAAESYTSQRLKLRLKKCFGDAIVFHQPFDRTRSELLYSSSISLQDVINSAYQYKTAAVREVPRTSMDDSDRKRLLYRTAKLIKSEITDCQGISVQPLNINDLTITKTRALLPDGLYWLLRWIIARPGKDDDELSSPECNNSSDERRVLMIAQDIVHCASHARTNMPKHAALGIAIRHMTRSKQLITMLSRMGHCNSYDDIEAMDTSLAKEILAKSDMFGVVLPSKISPSVFVQDHSNIGLVV